MSDDNAFPRVTSDRFDGADCVSGVWSEGGLTKRELFAAMAMQGLLSNTDIIVAAKKITRKRWAKYRWRRT
jgi:hypothetical protein